MAQPIWNASNKSYSLAEKTDPKDRIEIEVGDSQDSTVFHPQMKLMRWDNEANVSFRLVHDFIPGNVTQTESNGVIEWKKKQGQNTWIARFYEDWGTPEGAYKFIELVLPAKPPTNQISFTTTSKDVDFLYQPPLTPEEIAEGAERPEEVVGSYAIYSKSSGGLNKADGKEYKAGKVGHLYRAKLIDNAGNETWGNYNTDLNETGILTLSVDQTWLNNAVYPVIVDPTFGYTSVGGSNGFQTTIWAGGFTSPSEAGDITSVSVYTKSFGTVNLGVAIYAGSYSTNLASVTSKLAEDSGNVSVSTTPNWYSPNIAYSFSASTVYWLAEWASSFYYIYYDTSTSMQNAEKTGQTFETWPNPFSETNEYQRYLSIYATYTASGGGTVVKDLIGGFIPFAR